ncbi:uncharacterized protein NECHADRAFT_94417 [Fusarium vanettenii 77-13-4]|uniref:Uncharacterized protein n=1 Tax=Fusarium vanettenii (strain ATCC MYA-4622 / CBS 123669 / FGSC 9596 / NRRL 45880 / 77-13-4) TaxID=660122 RepID=C7Z8X7_FUSV7|nr:uncharacterized protein NECHADRAFT_94417 [Fusarium vanettenii 77-13-4]EEU39051.1 hypothetical protein NECHADRAFT_94417 [Fusarium vanettenii 77-13-4]
MGQRTFTLIPKFPGREESPDTPPLRPMTSKQVRKAYKSANKGPKLTRAEIWKQEKAEQERIRKEFEKEKAAAKAKILREKKKEKELAEKAEKRKKGLPLVNVRPSQETISWFVRGNGSAKKRDAKGKDVRNDTIEEEAEPPETTIADTIDEEPQQPAKRVRTLESIQEDEQDTPDVGAEAMTDDEMRRPSSSPRHDMLDMDDELDADFEEDLALELLEDLEAAAEKGCDQNSPDKDETTHESAPGMKVATSDQDASAGIPLANRYEEDLGLHRPNPPSVNFIKPALPNRLERPPASPSPSPPRQAPPMSTQAILFNFDDFFPSSSQQARELEEDDDIIPSAPPPLSAIVEEEEEALDEEPEKPADPDPLPSLGPLSDSPSPPLRRFFTSSGSHEQMSLALHRSRRTEALEKIQQRERARVQAGMVARAEAESSKTTRPPQSAKTVPKPQKTFEKNAGGYKPRPPQIQAPPLQEKKNPPHYTTNERHNTPMTTRRFDQPPKEVQRAEPTKSPTLKNNKENQKPPPQPSFGPSASQESYGGDWVDEIALELMI